MGRYIKEYQTENDVQTAIDNGELLKPYVAYIESSNTIDWDSKSVDYKKKPLTFNITSDGIINWIATSPTYTKTIEYSKNGGDWTSITSSTGGTQISVVSGDTVQFRGDNDTYRYNNAQNKFQNTTAGFVLEGNIMSMINSTNFSGLTTLQSFGTFSFIFQDCTGLTDASNLKLPATTIVNNCYEGMFHGCYNLTTAPELPATTLARRCYKEMFRACWSLNYIKCLATDISDSECTLEWVVGVPSNGTFVKASNMTSWSSGDTGIPTGWTVIDA